MKLRRRSHVHWGGIAPKTTLIVKKRNAPVAAEALKAIGTWLQKKEINVMVEETVKSEEFPEFSAFDLSLVLNYVTFEILIKIKLIRYIQLISV